MVALVYMRNSDSSRCHGRGNTIQHPVATTWTLHQLKKCSPFRNSNCIDWPWVVERRNRKVHILWRRRKIIAMLQHPKSFCEVIVTVRCDNEFVKASWNTTNIKVSSFPDDTDSSPEQEHDTRTGTQQQQQPRRTFLEQRVYEMRVAKLADARLSPREAAITGTPIIHPQNSPSASSTTFFAPSPAHDSIQPKTTASGQAGPMSSRAFSLVKERRRAAANTRTPALPSLAPSTTTVTTSVSRSNRPVFRTPVASTTPKKNTPRTTTPRDNYDSGPSTRRNLDKKTVRLLFSKYFSSQIDQYRQESIHSALTPKLNKSNNYTLKLFVRKRPIFAKQVEQGDFDVVEILDPEKPSDAATAVVVYKLPWIPTWKPRSCNPLSFRDALLQHSPIKQLPNKSIRPL